MSKFVMECPNCRKYVEASTGFFSRKTITCSCGYLIRVRTDKMTSRHCPYCGNDVVFDQSKGKNAKCLVCGEPINTMVEQDRNAEFHCAQCGVKLVASKAAGLPAMCRDAETMKAVRALFEEFKFSDSVSSEATADIEIVLFNQLTDLKAALQANHSEEASLLAQQTLETLKERNRISKANKQY